MKNTTWKKLISAVLLLCILCLSVPVFSACRNEGEADYLIAYTNSTNDDVEYYPYVLPDKGTMTKDAIVNDLITQLFIVGRDDGVHYSPLPDAVKLQGVAVANGVVTLDFDDAYGSMTNVQEIILKACVVLTLVQVEEVESILFTINGKPLKDSDGNEVGAMNPDQYVNILLSDEELLKQETSLRIFFTDQEGTCLQPVDYQFTLDNQTQSLEEYILRKLIEGPDENAGYPTLDPELELISVMTTDNTCYVNFSARFLEQNQTVSDDIMIYSIVNSLAGLAYINNVQFLVEGESDIILHKTFDLSKPLFRRYDLIAD